MFQQASDAMWVHDMDTGAMLDLNEAAVEFFGYSADEQKAIGIEGLIVPGVGVHDGARLGVRAPRDRGRATALRVVRPAGRTAPSCGTRCGSGA